MAVHAELETRSGARRLVWSAFALAALTVLLLARWLEPDPRGFGTHVQLGLPPCAFHSWTGLPCPTCGLTTSFAYMARWQLTPAFAAHPLGPLLFAFTVVALLCALHGVARGSHVAATFQRLRIRGLTVIIAISTAVCWVLRLAVMLSM